MALDKKLFRKKFHPCGGFYLTGVLRWLVPSNGFMLVIGAGMLAFDIYKNWRKLVMEHRESTTDFILRLGIWVVFVIHLCIGIPMDILLYRATKKKNVLKLKIWAIVNFFNTLLALSGYIARTSHFGIHLPVLITPYLFYVAFRLYMSVIIYYYGMECEEEEEIQANARMLTEAELQEFEEGISEAEKILEIQTKNLIEKVQHLRYKREEFEIDMDNLDIDRETPLGSGSYGVVYRALYTRPNGKSQQVAVKTWEPGIMDAQCFKALLAELKVMTYLGQHENVLGLVGAVTSEIRMRSLHMVLEFCPLGCLLDFLKGSRALFSNFVKDGVIVEDNKGIANHSGLDDDVLTTFQLIRWAKEVSSGMEYLEDMKVVHGDLAARNLLLTENKQIKIADFGLARQLYQYSVYVKRQNAPLPWRILALESILDMNFSSKSDVWAFGILLHELFTLGEIPYEDVKQFTLDFIESLRNGMRLEQSPLCPNVVYQIMKKCWNEEPSERPSFRDLHKIFYSLEQGNLVRIADESEDCEGNREESLCAIKSNEYTTVIVE